MYKKPGFSLVKEQMFHRSRNIFTGFYKFLITFTRSELSQDNIWIRKSSLPLANVITIAGIAPFIRRSNQTGRDRVQMDVPSEMNQISLLVNQFGLERSLKERADPVLLAVDGFCVRDAKWLHNSLAEHVRLQVHEQMVVSWHQTVSYNVDQFRPAIVAQTLDKEHPVFL